MAIPNWILGLLFVGASHESTSKSGKWKFMESGKWKQPINKKAPTKEKLCDQIGSHHNDNPNKK